MRTLLNLSLKLGELAVELECVVKFARRMSQVLGHRRREVPLQCVLLTERRLNLVQKQIHPWNRQASLPATAPSCWTFCLSQRLEDG